MQITKVLSYLGAWGRLRTADSSALEDIEAALAEIDPVPVRGRTNLGHHASMFSLLSNGLASRGWTMEAALPGARRLRHVDLLKDGIAVEVASGNQSSAVVALFARLPLFMRAESVDLPVLVVLTSEAAKTLAIRIATFEYIEELIDDLHPLPFFHPLVVLGIGSGGGDVAVRELSTDLDHYLVVLHGLTFEQMLLERERSDYDFKEILPDNDKIAKELCGFANRSGGGTLIVGVTDDGEATGLDRAEIDGMQLRVSNIASTACSPVPSIEFRTFAAGSQSSRSLLTIRVNEMREKPCMARDRVFVRYGTSARPARPDEVRRLVLG